MEYSEVVALLVPSVLQAKPRTREPESYNQVRVQAIDHGNRKDYPEASSEKTTAGGAY